MTAMPLPKKEVSVPVKVSSPRLAVEIISTGLSEMKLFEYFLSLGWHVKKERYYSLCNAKWTMDEKSCTLYCVWHCGLLSLRRYKVLGALPEFKVYFVGNIILVQKEFVGDSRKWLEERGQSIEIATEVIKWVDLWEQFEKARSKFHWPIRRKHRKKELHRSRTIWLRGSDPEIIGLFAKRYRRIFHLNKDAGALERHLRETEKMDRRIKQLKITQNSPP